jgi:transketolase
MMMHATELERAGRLAAQLRVDSIRCSTEAGSGHPTSSLSAADLMAVLLVGHLRYDWDRPGLAANDHLIFSKGHASPLLYAMFRAVGVIGEEELVKTYRKFGARLQGHPTPVLPRVDVATGSLGQGLPDAVGICLAGRYLNRLPYHAWVLCGDSETAEGSIWEAIDKASHYRLGNLTAVIDVNRLGQRGPTELEWDMDRYARRFEAFGARPLVIDGHNLTGIDWALTQARADPDRPAVILARTVKAKGVPQLEDMNGWHGRALPAGMAASAVTALGGPTSMHTRGALPRCAPAARLTRDHAGTRRRRARRRGRQLHPRRGFRQGRPQPVLRDVHRRTGAGRRGHRPGHARLPAVRGHVRSGGRWPDWRRRSACTSSRSTGPGGPTWPGWTRSARRGSSPTCCPSRTPSSSPCP